MSEKHGKNHGRCVHQNNEQNTLNTESKPPFRTCYIVDTPQTAPNRPPHAERPLHQPAREKQLPRLRWCLWRVWCRVDLIWDQRVEANVETTDPPAVGDGEEEHLQQPRRRFYQDNRAIWDDLRVSSTLARLRMSQHLISQKIGTFYMQQSPSDRFLSPCRTGNKNEVATIIFHIFPLDSAWKCLLGPLVGIDFFGILDPVPLGPPHLQNCQ